MNKWEKVAKLLDLELEEEFHIEGKDETYKVTNEGFKLKRKNKRWYHISVPEKLFSGEYVISKKKTYRWTPLTYMDYYSCTTDGDVFRYQWRDCDTCFVFWKIGNCFKTEEEAKTKGKEIMEQVRDEFKKAGLHKVFDLRPGMIIKNFSLTKPTFEYHELTNYGHFGRPDLNLPWEKLDKVDEIQKL